MKVKIFLGEYAYIYRGNMDLREMNEYIKTLTNRAFIIKWKDQEDDLITISKKQDLIYFSQLWSQTITSYKQSFRLYVFEMPFLSQNVQPTQLQSSTQIFSKMHSPSQRQSCTKQFQGLNQFTFNPLQFESSKSQEYQKERYSQLQSIQEIQGSSKNISNQNLDKVQFQIQQNEEVIKQRLNIDFNNIQSQDLSTFMNMDMKQSINTKEFAEVQIPNDDDYENDREIIDGSNIYCDYCSDKIQRYDEYTLIYGCQFCEDFHVCKMCFDQHQEQVHIHQLKEKFLQ